MPRNSNLTAVPEIRIKNRNRRRVNAEGRFVLYWMTANRRMGWNFALQRAVEWAKSLKKPLLTVESLACGRRWASVRHHAFVLEGMADNAAVCKKAGVLYYPFVERHGGETIDLITALAGHSCLIVADYDPVKSFNADTLETAAEAGVLFECVDSNGLLPVDAADKVFTTAFAFRRFLQRVLPDHLLEMPIADPVGNVNLPKFGGVPREISERWPPASARILDANTDAIAALPVDSSVAAVETRGGPVAAVKRLKLFLSSKLAGYQQNRNHPDIDGTSRLSTYLHYGQISAHEIFYRLAKKEGWSPDELGETTSGKREGWWGMSQSAEAFCDELVTWREVGFNMCAHTEDYDLYDSLPDWAKATLEEHMSDRREHVYSLEQFERGATHDRIWNAAQTQLVEEGIIHNYMRMLWGKKILEWSQSPREALRIMIELNNKYAIDGQDPNSYSGIFWVLGRYDRAWGPERPIFGKIRYMSSRNTARKLKLEAYLDKFDKTLQPH